jgi:hypothetical protein
MARSMTSEGLESAVHRVGVGIPQLGEAPHGREHARAPGVERGEVVGLQRVRELSAGRSAADAQVLTWLHEERRARHRGELGAQPAHHLIGAGAARLERRQGDEDGAGVRRRAARAARAGVADDGIDRRVHPYDVDDRGELLPHRLERDVLVGDDRADDGPGVLLREKPLRDDHEQHDVRGEGRGEDGKRQPRVIQHPFEALPVDVDEALEEARTAAGARLRGAQQLRAEHRRSRERNRHRHHNRDRQRHGELAE